MTSGDEIRTPASAAVTRRSARTVARPARPVPRAADARWSRRRGVVGVFAGLAAMGFAAAYLGPAGLALASDQTPAGTTVYAATYGDAQSLALDGETVTVEFDRGGYTAYETPKPTPTPTPEPAAVKKGGGIPAPLLYTGGGSSAEWMAAAGIAESDWGYVDYIVGRESGWNPNATNRSSGACGLVQALPCSKVPGNGYDPVDNLRWGNGYAVGRYGSWQNAFAFWTSNHWW
ncbi:transglycosylase SLT domain-containing protein [Microbacterium sp. cx-59]|uniref:aggregation-promoting factor C-terminal-like domain-containing protein n=1 Tax=Microbacterium sp. cx-59 TaxID=2891207 RepID=UPI001E4012CB|nr:transglycosylase SLT domain-containing protein [Microbacterium sp. cx-59]MCC4907139.1 lytic transglycosylase domain-containing protein [Microbacterium sp. cx-59]